MNGDGNAIFFDGYGRLSPDTFDDDRPPMASGFATASSAHGRVRLRAERRASVQTILDRATVCPRQSPGGWGLTSRH